ncbi:MAG: M20/M25/M40 family metallo-hydrolase [Myxococcota bacterium]|nr:M20/M25/M40 family metallo-hydrolase [Myxococcota bacterium]
MACLAALGIGWGLLAGVPGAGGEEPPTEAAYPARLLAELIRFPSVNPPGGEGPLAAHIVAVLEAAGLEARIIPTPRLDPGDPPRAAAWARLPGSGDGRPLILLSHLDVVPADPEAWETPPFAGVIDDRFVHGRGALDAKGVTAVHLAALLRLAREGTPLERDILFLATPDEETGGLLGARYIVEEHPELLGNAEFLLTEGGSIRPARASLGGSPPVPSLWGITITEKGPCWLELTTRGKAGHGSAPRPDAAIPRLIAALDRVRRIESPIRVLDEVADMFRVLAPDAAREDRVGFASLASSLEKDPSFRRRFLLNPGYNAVVRNTISITVLDAGSSTNVVPGEARARLDVRLLPGESCEDFAGAVRDVIADPAVEVETLLSFPSRSSPVDTPLFEAIQRVAYRLDPEALVVPRMIGGFTDAHWFRDRQIVAYGFVPRWLGRADTGGVHGIDEKVSLENLVAGVDTLVAILRELDAPETEAPKP